MSGRRNRYCLGTQVDRITHDTYSNRVKHQYASSDWHIKEFTVRRDSRLAVVVVFRPGSIVLITSFVAVSQRIKKQLQCDDGDRIAGRLLPLFL